MRPSKKFVMPSHRDPSTLADALDTLIAPMLDRQRVTHQEIPIDRVAPNPFQPRRSFEGIDELAAAIRQHGFISELWVRPTPGTVEQYQLVYGERRLRAAKAAGLTHVPCMVAPHADADLIEIGLVENIQRQDLNPLDEAHAFQAVITEQGYTQQQLADRIGKSRNYVEERLALLRTPNDLQDLVRQRPDTVRLARELAKLSSVEERQPLIEQVIHGALALQDIRALVHRHQQAPPPHPTMEASKPPSTQVSTVPNEPQHTSAGADAPPTRAERTAVVSGQDSSIARLDRQLEQGLQTVQVLCSRWRLTLAKLSPPYRQRLVGTIDQAVEELLRLRTLVTDSSEE